jgi:teichuronic acid biosynthesis glycosyltransferase TuaG
VNQTTTNKSPLVSIITATYNAENYIQETYQSIYDQCYSNWEWVVTDDYSNDQTLNLLFEIAAKDSRVLVAQNSFNAGSAVTRNNSIDRCSGDLLAFLDADDTWIPHKLSAQVNFMRDQIEFSFTAYEIIQENGEPLGQTVDRSLNGSFGYEEMLRKKATLGCSTVMIRRSLIDSIRMPDIRRGQDYAFWLMILRQGNRAHVLNSVLTQYRITPNSVSRNKLKKSIAQWKIYRNLEGIEFLKSVQLFCHYAWNAVFRRP